MITGHLAVTIIALAALSTMYKVSQIRKCESWVFLGSLYTIGAIAGVAGWLKMGAGFTILPKVLLMGFAMGAVSMSCLVCLLKALGTGGKLSLVTIISKTGISIPIIFAVIFQGERMSHARVVGLLLFVVFLVLVSEPRKVENKEETA